MQVRKLAGLGIREDDLSALMEISPPTLRKYFAKELQQGHTEATAKVSQSLFDMATNSDKPNVVAAIFWMKCRGGWRENSELGKKEAARQTAEEIEKGDYSAAPIPLRVVK